MRRAGDRRRKRRFAARPVAIHREIFDGYATNVPKASSHRITDPDYRAKYVEYIAGTAAACDSDPQYAALNDEMPAAVRSMAWTGGLMSRKTGGNARSANPGTGGSA